MSTKEIEDKEFASVFEADRRRKMMFAIVGVSAMAAMVAFVIYFGTAAAVAN
ncbi:MAG: hypothetical protein R3E66_07040 [bacterium]